MPTEIKPNPGPQEQAFACPADILIYGGAAGGGKTFYLLSQPLRHIANPKFRCVIFRRTSEQIRQSGGLWDHSQELYPPFEGKGRENTLDYTFPSGAKVDFEHLQHDKDKLNWMGSEIDLICFDELTHFSESQFWYLLSRNRSLSGIRPYIRASCNPDPSSFVANLVAWWIDQSTGLPIAERSGVVRYFRRVGDDLVWSDEPTDHELEKSFSFIPAALDDNPVLTTADPQYKSNLESLPRIERERLKGNWKVSEATVIDPAWWQYYAMEDQTFVFNLAGETHHIGAQNCRRFATVDTAGTSRDKAEAAKGKPPSSSALLIWDYWQPLNILLLRYAWRRQVDWSGLKTGVNQVLSTWNVPRVYIENAHVGPALKKEIKGRTAELVGPVISGMSESHRGAKLDRAIASGVLSRIEDGLLLLPYDDSQWRREYLDEWGAWQGLPEETSDQIDSSSYAAHIAKRHQAVFGGIISAGGMTSGR